MRLFILGVMFLFTFNLSLFSANIKNDKLKKSRFYYPVLTLNNEIGQRFAFFPINETGEDDFEITDSYSFKLGYYKIMQQFSKTSKVRFKYAFNNKDYDIENTLNNNAQTYTCGFTYVILPTITGDFNIRYKEKNYIFDNAKDNNIISPGIELKVRPRKGVLIGAKYVYQRTDYINNEKNSKGNRVLVYWQDGFYEGHLRLRARYRVENRRYLEPSKVRKNSSKQAISLTAKIDFN